MKIFKDRNVFVKVLYLLAVGTVCGVAGFFLGRFIRYFKNSSSAGYFKNDFNLFLAYAIPVIALIIMFIFFGISIFSCIKASKTFKVLNLDDEESVMKLDQSLNLPITLMNIWTILNLLFFSLFVEILEFCKISDIYYNILSVGTVVFPIVTYIATIMITRKCVELIKKINPEKQGDILDVNFKKKWEESCDEAQKLIIYKSSYKAFKKTNSICGLLWVICLIAQISFNVGVMPVLCVSAIWLVLVIKYCVESAKLEK